MKKNSIKMQLSAMNDALVEFAEQQAQKEQLNAKEINSVKQRTLYAEPYNNMEVYRSNKLYKTMLNRAETTVNEIKQMKVEETE